MDRDVGGGGVCPVDRNNNWCGTTTVGGGGGDGESERERGERVRERTVDRASVRNKEPPSTVAAAAAASLPSSVSAGRSVRRPASRDDDDDDDDALTGDKRKRALASYRNPNNIRTEIFIIVAIVQRLSTDPGRTHDTRVLEGKKKIREKERRQ
ncbi:Hypothetical protein CINCED_3A012662 [Cinara cedri]|uniref:Uncharacterized protein n=1 Tax=Cinara cedri TaxID=506608 RepID=A0A5E4MZT9_9HEMI|nr:Hypothetical protein CINCED_3A012662 [Cinara cedri]